MADYGAPQPRSEESSRHVAMFLGVMISLSLVMTSFAAARIYTRAFIFGKLMFADWLVIIAFCLILLSACLACIGTRSGVGVHGSELTPAQYSDTMFWFLISCFPSTVGLAVPKLAIVSLLCQVFDPMTWHRTLLWTLTGIGMLNSLVSGVSGVFYCIPIRAAWDWTVLNSECLPLDVIFNICYYVTIYAAALDFYLAIYPAIMLKAIQSNLKKRIGLTILLALGLLASALSFYKITILGANDDDFTYNMARLLITINTEATLIMIGVCSPTLYPLVRRIREKLGHKGLPIGENPAGPPKSINLATIDSAIDSDTTKVSTASSRNQERYWNRNKQTAMGEESFSDRSHNHGSQNR